MGTIKMDTQDLDNTKIMDILDLVKDNKELTELLSLQMTIIGFKTEIMTIMLD